MFAKARAVAWIVIAAGVVSMALLFVVDAQAARTDALRALDSQAAQAIDTRSAQSRRISTLLVEVEQLRDAQQETAELIGQLREDIVILRAQIETLGGTPAVPE